MRLLWKLAIPQIIIVIGLVLISFFVIDSSFVSMREEHVKDVLENRIEFIVNQIGKNAQISANESSLFVRLPPVIEAYTIALKNENAYDRNAPDPYAPEYQQAREYLRKELEPILKIYEKVAGHRIELHFHLPNGASFARLWRDPATGEYGTGNDGRGNDISDDLRSYRHTVMNVLDTGEMTLGFEAGSGGVAVRGVIPVMHPGEDGVFDTVDDYLIGSAEVLQQFSSIFEAAADEGKVYVSLYANAELIDFAVELDNPEKYQPKGDFIRVIEAKNASVESLITPELLLYGKNATDTYFEDHGYMSFAVHPISDYKGDQIGVIVCAMDTTTVSALASTASNIVVFMLMCITVVPIFSLLFRLRRLVISPLNMITSKIKDIAEDRADLSEQIVCLQKDIIGTSVQWFNTLTAKLDTILKERQEMAHWYKSILDDMPFSVSVQDTDMNWVFVNAQAEKMIGKKREDIIGLPCSSCGISICNTDNCALSCAKRGSTQTHFVHNGVSYQVDITMLKNLQDETTGFVEVIQDMSEIEEMAKHEAEAKAANSAKSGFLANMSHEIRTPMNAIMGMTALGKASNTIERAKYSFEKIEDASKHLLGIINDILDMSKIEAGKFELSEIEFSFEKMIQRVVNVIYFRVDEKKQKFDTFIDNNVPPVLIGDDQRLAQIITNLLGNAVKFTPVEGSVSMNATLIGEKDGFCEIKIEVVDSGIGISAEQQTRLFQTFQQAESSTSRKYGGTGLGLSISKSIVEVMGGRIWVESEIDKGSCFVFTVKLKRGDSDRYALTAREANWKGWRILAIDDNRGILAYLKSFVESFGAQCDVATCGKDALEIVREKGSFDIYIIDWKMADIDALQLTKGLRAIESDKSKIIITMVSSIEWGDIEERAKRAGVDEFLPKPLLPSAMIDIINNCVYREIESETPQEQVVKAEYHYDFSGHTILIAEDIEINREIMHAILEETGIAIEFAESGNVAVSMFEESPGKYSMILMDIQMPEMDGYRATQAIRALDVPRAKEIPIIAMTANVFREDIEKCQAAGMNDHIGKPVETGELFRKIKEYIAPVPYTEE